jgi:hypothetical protein
MEIYEFITRNIAEAIGLFALVGLLLFVYDYSRETHWRINEQGRAVMYMASGLSLTIIMLIVGGFFHGWEFRWALEVLIYLPMAISCWYLRYALRKSMGMPSIWLFMAPRRLKRRPKPTSTKS